MQCRGQNIVNPQVADVVFAVLEYPGGKLAHVHVSWLDPHKSRKLVVVGSRKMVVFDDTLPVSDGRMEIGTSVPLDQLREAMEDWFRRKGYLPKDSKLTLEEI